VCHAIETHQLTKRFPGPAGRVRPAVDHLGLIIPPGQLFGLVGPDGAGKTTTIRMLCGVLTPTEGGGRVAGFDIAKQVEQVRARIGYMPQAFSLYHERSSSPAYSPSVSDLNNSWSKVLYQRLL